MAPAPHYTDEQVTVHHGDSLDVLATMADNSIEAVVCDPPYGLEFMGNDWDRPWAVSPTHNVGYAGREDLTLPAHRDNRNANCRTCGGRQRGAKRCICATPAWDRRPAEDMAQFQQWCAKWATQCLRILKPGGHLLAFGGTRTWHRLACAIEDAGFEIRDTITWLYGQGFPKSLDVSAAVDRRRASTSSDEVNAVRAWLNARRLEAGLSLADVNAALGAATSGGGLASAWMTNPTSKGMPDWDQWCELKALLGFGDEMDAEVRRLIEIAGGKDRPVVDTGFRVRRPSVVQFAGLSDGQFDITGAATESAAAWAGWGTALKPASEPIVMARKPIAGTVAANVTAHRTGALNIDACRTGEGGQLRWSHPRGMGSEHSFADDVWTQAQGRPHAERTESENGRWPTNVVLAHLGNELAGDLCADGCAPGCPVAELDQQSGVLASGANPTRRGSDKFRDSYGNFKGQTECKAARGADSGGASRFFPSFRYEAKAGSAERPRVNGVAHPTVKPISLMRWLVRLVTPPGGLVLDPFAGSGTTAEACILEGFRCVTIEREAAYLPLITARLAKPQQPVLDLFGGAL